MRLVGRHPADRKKMAAHGEKQPQRRRTGACWSAFPGYTLVECKLETGRTHQIRVHVAYRGHPILGDMVYGRKSPNWVRTANACTRKELRFTPRTGKPVTVSCELPDYFAALLEKLRSGCRRALTF